KAGTRAKECLIGDKCMDDMTASRKTGAFGASEQVAVERGLNEFRAGRPIILTAAGESVVALPVDGMTDPGLNVFRQLCLPARPCLLIPSRRGRPFGLGGISPVGLAIGALLDAAAIFALAADRRNARRLELVPAGAGAGAAIALAKLAQRLPAL